MKTLRSIYLQSTVTFPLFFFLPYVSCDGGHIAKSNSGDGSIDNVAVHLNNQAGEIVATLVDMVGFGPAPIQPANVKDWIKNNKVIHTGRSKKIGSSEMKEDLNQISRERISPHSFVAHVLMYVISADDLSPKMLDDEDAKAVAAAVAFDAKDGVHAVDAKEVTSRVITNKMAAHAHLLSHCQLLPG